MSNCFCGAGNLGDAPTLKRVSVSGNDSEPVLEMSIYFDRPVPGDKEGEWKDKGGFWLNAELWGSRAEIAARHLSKGARVRAEGQLVQERWEARDSGEEKTGFRLKLDWIALDMIRIDRVTFKPKSSLDTKEPAHAGATETGDDIPY